MSTGPTIFIVDDDPAARASAAALVTSIGVTTESFSSAEEFLEAYDPSRPGCLVTDMRMLGMSGVELLEKLASQGCSIPVIVITAYANVPITVRAMQAGAVTLLEKPCVEEQLCDNIRKALKLDLENREKEAKRQEILKRIENLSPSEQQVMDLMVTGNANKVIACKLDVSVRTVEMRRHNIFKKMQAGSLAALVQLAMEVHGEEKALHANES